MEANLKGCLKGIVLELRRQLEGCYDAQGNWQAGDLERRLAAIGVRRDRPPVPVNELPHLSREDQDARGVVDAFMLSREEAGVDRGLATAEFVTKCAYTWANRLLALRCMEARALIDEVVLQKDVYGGRSLQHSRLARKSPERCAGVDEGLFAVLFDEFERRAIELPLLFNPKAPEVALRPSVAAVKHSVAILSGTEEVKGQGAASDEIFTAPEALGWAYQYWNSEEKDRVFEKVRTQKGAKIEGAEIIPATCIYTEPYIVKFLVQNSLGALWAGMHPEFQLPEKWEYFVRDVDRAPVQGMNVKQITFLDPACGSGHFLLEAFDFFFDMYQQEGQIIDPAEICADILEHNLYGIDIDQRSVQIAALALIMKAKEKAPSFVARRINLIATNICLPTGKDHLEAFLRKHPDDAELKPALLTIFAGLAHADELGSLLQIEEPVDRELRKIRQKLGGQLSLTGRNTEQEWDAWKIRVIGRLHEHFEAEAKAPDLAAAFFGEAGAKGLSLVEVLARRYDVVAANPPYMGSHRMGKTLLGYLKDRYPGCSRDLYAAFLRRSREFLSEHGSAALVTMHGYLFLSSLESLRTFLLRDSTLEVVVHLGAHAFQELGDHAPAALVCFRDHIPVPEHEITFFDLTRERDKRSRLMAGLQPIRRKQQSFLHLPAARMLYTLPDSVARLFADMPPLEDSATGTVIRRGLDTGAVPRFVRCHWEVHEDAADWVPYCKGGDTRKWYGNSHFVVRWSVTGTNRIELTGNSIIPNRHLYFHEGLTFSRSSGTGLNARFLPSNTMIGCEGPGILGWPGSVWELLGFLGSRAVEYVASVINSSMHYQTGDIAVVPLPTSVIGNVALADIGRFCHDLAQARAKRNPIDRAFEVGQILQHNGGRTSLVDAWNSAQELDERIACLQHCAEALADEIVFGLYGVAEQATASRLLAGIGVPPAWNSLISTLAELPPPAADIMMIPGMISASKSRNSRQLAPEELQLLKHRIEAFYKAVEGGAEDLGAESEPKSDSEDEESAALDSMIPIPAETSLEELSRKLEVHPISVYWLLRELRDKDGVVCQTELRRFVEDYVSVMILRLIGHRWPHQVEGGHQVPPLCDADGIITLAESAGQSTLLELVRERIAIDFGPGRVNSIEQEFEQITGKTLGSWMATDFFPRHVSQFRKRPIAWHIESAQTNRKRRRRGRGNAPPAFSCLVYYHRMDADLFPKLRSQYVGPLRARFQTELAGLEQLDKRTADQDERRVQLEILSEELKDFDSRLEQVITGSFSSPVLETIAVREPLDIWVSRDGEAPHPTTQEAFLIQESKYDPDLNDGVRVNIAPLQKVGLLSADVLASKDVEKAIADRAEWRAEERRWCREGKLKNPGWWPSVKTPYSLPQMPATMPALDPAAEAAICIWALLHASGGSIARIDLARAFVLRSQPTVLMKLAPAEVRAKAKEWAARVGQRNVPSGLLAKVITDLAERDGIRVTVEASRVLITAGSYTPPEDRVNVWFRYEASLALSVLAALRLEDIRDVDAGIFGEDQKLLAEGAA